MMRDEIFYGNILGLLKKGEWKLRYEESIALIQIVQELERRLKPPSPPLIVEEPIKKGKKDVAK